MEHFKNHFNKYFTKKFKYEQLEQLEKCHKELFKEQCMVNINIPNVAYISPI